MGIRNRKHYFLEITVVFPYSKSHPYVTHISIINEGNLNRIKSVIETIKNSDMFKKTYRNFLFLSKGRNVKKWEKTSEELYGDLKGFEEFVSYLPNFRFYRIDSIVVYPYTKKERLL